MPAAPSGEPAPAVIHFRILGNLEIRRNGALVVLSAAKLRIILASLLLRAGRVVPVSVLVDRLWDHEPPAEARAALQTYVARLRRLLGADAAIHTRSGGYVIELPTGCCDLQEFDELLESVRIALGRGDRAAALESLRAATALWRGPILFDVDSAALHREEVPQVQERCLEAAARRFALELALGHHRAVVEELGALAAAYPFQEELRAHLMRALYRSGRQAEALKVYRDVAALLRTELGLDPGPELRAVHQAILLGEALDDDARDDPAPGSTALCQLPPAIGDFVGRAAQVAGIASLLATGGEPATPPIVVVSGVAGVGKSALAVHVAHGLRDRFPDGQLYVNLGGGGPAPRDVAEVLGELLYALGLLPDAQPRSVQARAATFRARVADRRILIVLDDAADARQVAPLLPGTASCAVLVTSRRSLDEIPAADRHRLQPFSVTEGVSLLDQILDPDRVAGERTAAEKLVDLCGRLPLAVRIIGARLQPRPTLQLRVLADRLQDEHRRLDELAVGDLAVRSELAVGYSGLAGPIQLALRRMGLLLAESFAAWTLGAITDGGDGERAIEQLMAAGLLEPVGLDLTGQLRYRPHDLVALYARELADGEDEEVTRAAYGRLLDTFLVLAHSVHLRVDRKDGLPPDPLPDGIATGPVDIAGLTADPGAWLQTERSQLLYAITQACRLGSYDKAALLADMIIPPLSIRGGYEQIARVRATVRDAARAAGDERVASRQASSRADVLLSLCLDEAAGEFEGSVAVFRRLGLRHELVHSLTGFAFARMFQGRPALPHAEEATAIAYGTGDPDAIVLALRTQADTLVLQDRPAEALPLLDRALAHAPTIWNTDSHRALLVRKLDCAISLGELDLADSTYAQAREVTDAVNNAHGLGWLLVHHSRLRRARGDFPAAMTEAREALRRMVEVGDPRGVFIANLRLAEALLAGGDSAGAAALLHTLLSTSDAASVPLLRARADALLKQAGSG
ncbi:BTAD domain-containing putative transcriptional regulator [Micromonospora sp. WMMD1102]|uniref:AfsR/SARP family transcriptional regulator n=1 Tax=Micromonospora sp. WMMD1102 TaxID=3016105 RepID=UPI0024151A7E|nr:AfsR/SARP family transcriptional regulator [Micromonospora sp. WMMD1102]MDG4787768.1 BTAD domain-containing putative transcriptional regulator [Micromonospora sp. WMMD1102]